VAASPAGFPGPRHDARRRGGGGGAAVHRGGRGPNEARARDLQARVVRAFESDGAPWIGKGRGGGQRRRRG
jgi:hypothetical protein